MVKIFHYSLAVILFFLFGNISAQDKKASELLKKERDEIFLTELNNPPKAIIRLQELEIKASKIGDQHFVVNCEALKATIYYINADYSKTLVYANKAEKKAKDMGYYDIQAIATAIIAMQYAKVGLKDEALKLAKEAMKLAETKDTILYIEAQHKVSSYYIEVLNECDYLKYAPLILELSKKCFNTAERLHNKRYIKVGLENLSTGYTYNGQFENAKKANRLLLKNYTGTSDRNDMLLYDNVGNLYLNTKQPDSAVYYLNKGLYLAEKLNLQENQLGFLNQLKIAYQRAGDSIKANIIGQKYGVLLEHQNLKKVDVLQTSVKNVIQKNQKQQEVKANAFKVVIFVFFIIIILLSFIYYTRFKKQKLSLEEKQKIIKEKQDNIEKLQRREQKSSILDEAIKYAVENNPVFLKMYKEAYPDFFAKLYSLSPELTQDDLKCCAMLHLNFSTKEIASYTHTSIRTIENRKFRIRKKINVLDSQKDLNEFLINL